MRLKKVDIIAPIIIAEADAWLLLAILRAIGFDLANFLQKVRMGFLFVPLNFALKFLPIILPLLALIYILVGSLFKERVVAIFQFFKFALVGSLNTFIDFGVLNLLMWLSQTMAGWEYSVFKAISFSSATFNSYLWNKFWTFQKKETKVGAGEFSKFYLATGIGFLINVGVASLIVNVIGPKLGISPLIWANIGAFVAVLCACIWNFSSYKFIIFKK
ncbi:GtrA family protein [bacterium]|nr:GtrA family protein [bacterium]